MTVIECNDHSRDKGGYYLGREHTKEVVKSLEVKSKSIG